MKNLQFEGITFQADFEASSPTPGGFILGGKNVQIEVPAACKSFYRHGWHSWALTAWTDLKPLSFPEPKSMNPFHTDPLYNRHPFANGSWVGAVDLPDGRVLLLGALGLDSHVQMRPGQLQGWFETNAGEATVPESAHQWFVGCGAESEVFGHYSQLLGQIFGALPAKKNQRVWCSWYSLYTAIDEKSLHSISDGLEGLSFDTIQVDDGWQKAIGDWQANDKFPSGMEDLAARIKSTGRRAGLWLAPLLMVPTSRLYKDHPNWILRDTSGKPVPAGFNWGEPLYAIDTTHPEVSNWLAGLMREVRRWGFEYVKLDFLYAGALPGKRYQDVPREAAYRQALVTIRQALGEDAYFLACGAPILPSLGLCDALRVGPDVSGVWESYRDSFLLRNPTTPGTRNAIRTAFNRLWLAPLVHLDPDVVYFRSVENQLRPEQKTLLQDIALICDFKATSDLPQQLESAERSALEAFLNASPKVAHTGRYTFKIDERQVDFSKVMPLPQAPSGLSVISSAMISALANQPFALKILDKLGKAGPEKLKHKIFD